MLCLLICRPLSNLLFMSPLKVELYNASTDGWRPLGEIKPGEQNGSLSDNLPDGKRDVYMFGVDEETNSGFILRSVAGIDIENSGTRAINSLAFAVVARLLDGDSHEMMIRTDRDQ